MVHVGAGQYDRSWFGVAWAGECFVATAIGTSQENAIRNVERCLPEGLETEAPNTPSSFLADSVRMLGELDLGHESDKRFTISEEYVSEPLRRILTAAAAIPIGYVTTYGNIAGAAGSVARAVGRVMATNPLYPIVPCHRVVGADMSLVGYGGRQDADALGAKLGRLQAELHGFSHEKEIPLADCVLTVFPAEWVLEATHAQEERRQQHTRRQAEQAAADRKQLRLF
jgi:O-6-methylguanine DNA methyltransferase